MTKVHIRHARKLGYCTRGIRDFCKLSKIDYSKFVFDGLDANYLRKFNNPQIEKIIEIAEKEKRDGIKQES